MKNPLGVVPAFKVVCPNARHGWGRWPPGWTTWACRAGSVGRRRAPRVRGRWQRCALGHARGAQCVHWFSTKGASPFPVSCAASCRTAHRLFIFREKVLRQTGIRRNRHELLSSHESRFFQERYQSHMIDPSDDDMEYIGASGAPTTCLGLHGGFKGSLRWGTAS